MKRKISLFLLSTLLLVLTFSSSLYAQEGVNTPEQDQANLETEKRKEEINKVFQELAEVRAAKLLPGNEMKIASFEDSEVSLEEKLNTLGVNVLSPKEVSNIYREVSPTAEVPPSNSNVRWYEARYNITRNGVTYALQDLYAQARGHNTNLTSARTGYKLYDNMHYVITGSKEVVKLYSEKAIGHLLQKVPVYGWLPWELLIPEGNQRHNNSIVVSHRTLSTVCFTYVKREGQSDSSQSMTFRSNMYTSNASITAVGITDGKGYSKTLDSEKTDYGQYYASGTKALDAYLDTQAQRSSYISSITFQSEHDTTKKLVEYLVTPVNPGQVQ